MNGIRLMAVITCKLHKSLFIQFNIWNEFNRFQWLKPTMTITAFLMNLFRCVYNHMWTINKNPDLWLFSRVKSITTTKWLILAATSVNSIVHLLNGLNLYYSSVSSVHDKCPVLLKLNQKKTHDITFTTSIYMLYIYNFIFGIYI